MVTTAEQMADLSPKQRAMLELRLWKRSALARADGILPRPGGMVQLPLSFSQQRLWFLQQLDPASPAYNMPYGLRLYGSLRPEILIRILDRILERHEVLRTRFVVEDGQPVQVILPAAATLSLIDLTALDASAREAELGRLATEEARLPFDLTQAPLLRARFVQLEPDEHALLVTMHHIVSDGWSIGLFVRELTALYRILAGGQPAKLPDLPIQYADYALWQRTWMAGEEMQKAMAYWREQLASSPPLLELPADRPRTALQTGRGGSFSDPLPARLWEDIAALSSAVGGTPFMVLLAGFLALLHRCTGQDDLVVGSPVANRRRREAENLIGFFVNTLALRVSVVGCSSFRKLLTRVRDVAVGAYVHQDLPFEMLVKELDPDRYLSHSPLFQVMFVLQNVPAAALELPGLTLSPLRMATNASRFDLSLLMSKGQDAVYAAWEYDRDLFDPASIQRIASHFANLLTEALAEPDFELGALSLLSDAGRHQLLCEWNDTREPRSETCVPDLFAATARRAPDTTAIVFEGRSLTYRELDRRANRLARHLRGMGIGPESLVAVVTERSSECYIGLLGILKAGGAYLPLDPDLPPERMGFILDDAGVDLLLTFDDRPGPSGPYLTLCALGAGYDETAAGDGDEPPLSGARPESLAYVIYTSGSTGRPKGTLISHGALANYVLAISALYELEPQDRVLQFFPFTFDASIEDVFPALSQGATLVCHPAPSRLSSIEMLELCDRESITVLHLISSYWHQMVQDLSRAAAAPPASVRIVSVGGEAVSASRLRIWAELTKARGAFLNVYGPTEVTVTATVYRTTQGRAAQAPYVPIGRPLANLQARVVDRDFRPVPIGVSGELCLGGAGLARGYLSRPDLTAERFIPDPFGAEPGGRLYRTGDEVRYLRDGLLEYRDRLDRQVKVRGFRIELGEIEAALEECPLIDRAAVVAGEERLGGSRLVAYVAPRNGASIDPREAQAFLRERLPDYMVPYTFLVLPALPLTQNGKVDRRALPPPPEETGDAWVAPRTPIEASLAQIWAELLDRERVGSSSDFFELGGHSLIAAQMIHRVRTVFDVALPLRALFELRTVAALALEIARRKADSEADPPGEMPQIVPDAENRHRPFPLNEVQQAYWIGRGDSFELGNVASHSYTEIEYDELDIPRLNQALARLIERHDMLRTVILNDGTQKILELVPVFHVKVIDLRSLAARAADALVAMREALSHEILPVDRCPLFEVRVSLLAERRIRVHLSLDALLTDAWSIGVLLRELSGFYSDAALELTPLDLSFRDYVLATEQLVDSPPFRRAEEYWRGRLATLPPAPQLPQVKSFQQIARPLFRRRSVLVPLEEWSLLKARAARAGLTPSGLLLAAFAEVLGLWSKSPRFTLNLTLFNRLPLHPQIHEIVGDFTSLTLLEVDLTRGESFEIRARLIQEQLWHDIEHRHIGGIRVLRMLARAQARASDALMPVVFTSTFGQRQDGPAEEGGAEPRSRVLYSVSQTPQVSLDFQVSERRGALAIVWDVVDEIFPAGLIGDIFAANRSFLAALAETDDWARVERPAAPGDQLGLFWQVNATENPVTAARLHAPFEEQAARRPDAIAVLAPERTLAYAELDGMANALAHRLLEAGARPNRLVAVVMEKGWEQIVAVLAILKAGAAYLPTDPELPVERRHYLLSHGEVSIALTQTHLEGTLDWPEGIRLLSLGAGDRDMADRAPETATRAEDLAYVIFTSGSTGLPKGVMIDHRGAVNTVLDVNRRFGVGPEDRVLALSSLSFDLSVYDIFGVLGAGGAVVLPEPAARRDPHRWLELARLHRVTLWNSVPTLLEMLARYLEEQPAADLFPLRVALLSGDWIPVSLPDQVLRLWPATRVISLGGATEASIWSILYPIQEVDPAWSSIPYGRPMDNQRFHVLNGWLEPCPVWVPGELYIGGIGLAQGYWRDEERTRGSFFEHPGTGERLYRTGDLGRFLPDGQIEFLGRQDSQVKIQGYRIELGEIESVLEQHPQVRSGVVTAVGEERGNRRLVAFIVPQTEEISSPAPAAGSFQWVAARQTRVDAAAEARPRLRNDQIGLLEFKLGEPGLRRGDTQRPALALLPPAQSQAVLSPYHRRRSHRRFSPEPVTLAALGRLLASFLPLRLERFPLPKYRYPSAGHLYPVQVYIHLKQGRIEGAPAGIYYHHPKEHRLAALAPGVEVDRSVYDPLNQPVFDGSAFAIFLIAQLEAIAPIYGREALDFCLLEAGYIGQLLMEVAAGEGLGLCPIGGLDFDSIRGHFQVGSTQVLIHSFLGGAVASAEPAAATAAASDSSPHERQRSPLSWAATADLPIKLLSSEVDRLEFKLAEHNVRRDGEGSGIQLPKVDAGALAEIYEARQSYRDFLTEPIPVGQLSSFLAVLLQVELPGHALPKYRYPSAGNLYPVQTYIYVKPDRIEGVPGGIYYYHPKLNRLVQLSPEARIDRSVHGEINRPLFDASAFSIFLIAQMDAIAPVYGEWARDFCLLEAGYMGQLLMEAGPEQQIGLCPVAGIDFAALRGSFALEEDHVLVHILLGGRIPTSRTATAAVGTYVAQEPLIHSVRIHLEQKLPSYMIPSSFMVLDRLPLTANGKVDRRALPSPEQSQDAIDRTYSPPSGALEDRLAALWSEVLGVERVGRHDNFLELGGDSILAIHVVTRAAKAGISFSIRQLFEHPTVAGLSRMATTEAGADAPLPLTPFQRYLLERRQETPAWCAVLEPTVHLDRQGIESAAVALAARHAVLRLGLARDRTAWTPIAGSELACLELDLSVLPPALQPAAVSAAAGNLLRSGGGLPLRLVLAKIDAETNRLIVSASRLAADLRSWRLLQAELEVACGLGGPAPGAQTGSFRSWVEGLGAAALSAREVDLWLTDENRTSSPLRVDFPEAHHSGAPARGFTISLDESETDALLGSVCRACRAQADEILLAAAVHACGRVLGEDTLWLDVIRDGRSGSVEEVEPTGVIGCFSVVFPVLLQTGPGETPVAGVRAVKERLRRFPRRGAGYGLLRYGRDEGTAAALTGLPRPQVLFDGADGFQADPTGGVPLSAAPDLASGGQIGGYLLEIRAALAGKILQVQWLYSSAAYRSGTMEALSRSFIESLRDLIAHSAGNDDAAISPTDFPLMQLDQSRIEKIFKKYGKKDRGE